MTARPTLAVLGGTGDLGGGLAERWMRAGFPVIIGSRRAEAAAAAAARFKERFSGAEVRGLENAAAATAAEIVILTVPYAHHEAMLSSVHDAVQGKVFVDTTVPLQPPKVRTVHLPPAGSAARTAQQRLGEGVRVVAAFHNVAAAHLQQPGHAVDCDVLVFGNDPAARGVVVGLAEAIGLTAWHAGRIDNAVVGEALTSTLIFINGRYKIGGAGIRITGTPGSADA